MEKTTFFTVVFLLLFASACWAAQGYKGLFHVHTLGWSDGHSTVEKVAEYAKKYGYQCIWYSDHGDSFKSVADFPIYRRQVEALTEDGVFVTIAGREITVGNKVDKNERLKGNNHHINTFSDKEYPYMYDSQYSKDQGAEVIDILHNEGGICVFNHPQTGPSWWGDTKMRFDGIEVFNDYWGTKDLKLYLKMLEKGWRGFVVGGADLHAKQQLELEVSTFVFSQELTRESIRKALDERSTIATKGIRSIETNLVPTKQPYAINDSGFGIDMEIKTESSSPTIFPSCQIYRNGVAYKKVSVTKGNSPGMQEIHFVDNQSGCYILVVPGYMVTSPFCFEKDRPLLPEIPDAEEEAGELKPGQRGSALGMNVLRIASAYDDPNGGIEIVTEDEAKAHRFRFYNFCGKDDLLYSESGAIVSCRDPLFTVYRQSAEQEIALRTGRECNYVLPISKKECLRALKGSYFIGINENTFLAIQQSIWSGGEFLLVTEDKMIDENEVFIACDSKGNFRFNDAGVLLSCDSVLEMSARRVEERKLFRLDGASTFLNINSYMILLR